MEIFNSQFSILNKKSGFSLVEVIVAVSIAIFSILAVWQTYTFFIKISLSNPSAFQASFLAEEGIEAVKFMRDSSWSANIAPLSQGNYYTLIFNGTAWEATTTPALIDNKFDRLVIVSDVYRDESGNISASGTLDPNTKKITVIVSWQKDASVTTREITTYVSNIFEN